MGNSEQSFSHLKALFKHVCFTPFETNLFDHDLWHAQQSENVSSYSLTKL